MLQFTLDQSNNVIFTNGDSIITDNNIQSEKDPQTANILMKKFIESLKIKCKQVSRLEKEVNKLQNQKTIFESKYTTERGKNDELKLNLSARNVFICNLIEVAEEYAKVLKLLTAKLEVYECPEKWVQHLTKKELAALSSHFRGQIENINNLIQGGKYKNSHQTKVKDEKNIKEKSPAKVTIRTKFEEAYVNNLLDEGKKLSAQFIPEDKENDNPTEGEKEINIEVSEEEKKTSTMLQKMQELILKLIAQFSTSKKENRKSSDLDSPVYPKGSYDKSSVNSLATLTPLSSTLKSTITQRFEKSLNTLKKNKGSTRQEKQIQKNRKAVSRSTSTSSKPQKSNHGGIKFYYNLFCRKKEKRNK